MKKNNTRWKILILTAGAALLTVAAAYEHYRLSLAIGLLAVCAVFYIPRQSWSTKQKSAIEDWTMQQPFSFAEQPGTRERIAETDEAENPFDAVARDLRKLAELTAQSASRISRTAKTIHAENEKVTTAMQEAAERMKQIASGAGRASEALGSIRQSVADTADQISMVPRSKVSASSPFAEPEHTMLM
ncbi:hypothetical protein CDO73_07575 [Saccharibacillus sp. O23]|uniref:hypothetical protein n=1 Tax=Saccharibacillus sp. O23 TaxID=2009338 RepID=UPI000B4E1908|nr:hypothetical protein [Saccharibacillus sp. O23]OWR31254.1 hypothetical protein CDO73_07575 [Saccharibacillus sp. O23]